MSVKWDRDVGVIVVGTGAMGLPAALRAQQAGASVLLLEAGRDIGGHAIVSGGNVPLGGGTSVQKKVRHCGFARPSIQGPGGLVGGRTQWLSGRSLQ